MKFFVVKVFLLKKEEKYDSLHCSIGTRFTHVKCLWDRIQCVSWGLARSIGALVHEHRIVQSVNCKTRFFFLVSFHSNYDHDENFLPSPFQNEIQHTKRLAQIQRQWLTKKTSTNSKLSSSSLHENQPWSNFSIVFYTEMKSWQLISNCYFLLCHTKWISVNDIGNYDENSSSVCITHSISLIKK